MATGEDPSIQSEENLDYLLKCNICFETLKEPKRLPCLHTFCKSCIHSYVISVKEKKDEISCPVCRQTVSSEIRNDVDNMVENLPADDFIVSLLNKLSMAKSEKLCDSCNINNKEMKAITWCNVCEEAFCDQCQIYHKSFKMSASHELIPITDIGKTHEGANISKVIFCDDHKISPVQVYCVDHKKACCTLCATLSHRKCDKVISIEEASSGIKQKPEVSNFLKQMDENIKLLADVINCRDENETLVDKQALDIEATVTKLIKEMKDHLDRLQNKILSELEAAKKTTSMKVADDINNCTSYKSAVTNWKSMLAGVVEHGSEQQCLNIFNDISPKMEKLQAKIKAALKNSKNVSIEYEVSKDVTEFERTIKSLGKLAINESKIKIETGGLKSFVYDFRNGKIKVIRTINVTQDGQTSGIFLDGLLLFTAYSPKKVIKYNQDGELLGELTVPTYPTDICHLSETQVVVSSNPNVFYIIDCKDMTLQKTMKLADVPVNSVCVYDNNQFLIGSSNQLTWIDQSSGTKVKSVKTSGQSYYVSSSINNDYISGDGDNSVSYVVNDTKKFTYTNNQLLCPRGIGIDEEGNFYITGCSSKSIHQVTDKGELIRIIPASTVGIQTPRTFRLESGTNRFLATCGSSGKATLCEIE